MKRWTLGQMFLLVGGSLGFWALLAYGCLFFGSTETGWPSDATIRGFRLEWTLVASLVGAALAAAGVAYQAILRNPLAEPYLLGVSSGAGLAVTIWSLFSLAWLPAVVGLQAWAFIGAILTLMVVFALAQRRGRLEPVTLLLVGVIVNAINAAFFLLLFHRGKTQDFVRAFRFLAGGLQTDLEAGQIVTVAGVFVAGWTILLYISGQLNVSMLSEAEAEALGVRIQKLRWLALIVASVMNASAVAISGPIGFVGLVCPHVARLLVGQDHRRLLPVATVLGACLLAMADVGSRRMNLLPVGVLTGFLGGPFFLFLLWRSQRDGGRR